MAAFALATAAGLAQAAGGHHAVDDAVILDPGQCELETWVSRASNGQHLAHLGPGCRVGPVELSGVVEDLARPSARLASIQLKAVTAAGRGWSTGGALTLAHGERPATRTRGVLLLATWTGDPWTLHFNAGRDLVNDGASHPRAGASVEWLASQRLQWIAERYEERGSGFVRGGARLMPTTMWQLDLSYAHRLHGLAARGLWTLGSTWQFGD